MSEACPDKKVPRSCVSWSTEISTAGFVTAVYWDKFIKLVREKGDKGRIRHSSLLGLALFVWYNPKHPRKAANSSSQSHRQFAPNPSQTDIDNHSNLQNSSSQCWLDCTVWSCLNWAIQAWNWLWQSSTSSTRGASNTSRSACSITKACLWPSRYWLCKC